jgi:hypothetical protein
VLAELKRSGSGLDDGVAPPELRRASGRYRAAPPEQLGLGFG